MPYGIRWEGGHQLPHSLENTFRKLAIPFCDVTGFGELASVVLQIGENGEPRRFEGPVQLIDLKGRLRRAGDIMICDLVCTVARLTDNGVQVLGGKLKEAEVSFLEITLTPLQSAEVAMGEVPQSAFPLTESLKIETPNIASPKIETPPFAPVKIEPPRSAVSSRLQKSLADDKPAVPTALPERWAKAVLESKRILSESDPAEDTGDERPLRGDIVLHQQFGECRVTRIEDDHVTLKKPDGRQVQLGLQILKFTAAGERGGRRVYRVEVRTKR